MSCDPKKVANRKLFDDFIISNISPGQLDQFVQSIAGDIYHKLLDVNKMNFVSEKERKNALKRMREKVLEEYKDWITMRVDAYKKHLTNPNPEIVQKVTGIITHFESYLNEWKKVDRLVGEYFSSVTGISEIDILLEDLDDGSSRERTSFDDDYTFLMDQRKGASARMKMLFGFIPKGKTYINSIKGFTATQDSDKNNSYYTIDEVFNTVTEILASSNDGLVDFTWEDVKAKLNAAVASYTGVKRNSAKADYVSKLIDILENQPQYVKNEFMVVMLKHFTPMKMVMVGDNTVKVIDANAYSIVKNLKRKWKENLKSLDLLDEDGFFKKDKVAELNKKITNAINDKTNLEPVVDVFNSIGVNISLEAWEYIRQFGLEHANKVYNWKIITGNSSKLSLLAILSENLKNAVNNDINIEDIDIIEDSIFNSLAKVQAVLDNSEYSHSHRVAGKTVFSYTNFKYSIQRILKLKFNENLRDQLSNNAYSKSSIWLNLFQSEDFKNRFGYSYVSLEAMRKEYSKSSDKGLEQLSSIDHEIYKTGIYFNQDSVRANGIKNASYMYFTMSDKKTQMMIHSYAFDINNGIMNTVKVVDGVEIITPIDMYEFLVDTLVQPEVDRILDSFNKDYNITGYKPDMFWNIPELNYELIDNKELRNAIYGEDGTKSISTMLTNPDSRNAVKTILKTRVEKLIQDKLNDWKNSNIGLVDGEFKFIDERVIKSFRKKVDKNLSTKQQNEQINRLLAEDYIVNGLIANNNISQLITGDPSLYFKEAKGNFKTSSEKVLARIYATLDNLGKRLAMDNAPRYAGAWVNKKYRQGFIQDAVMVSIDIQTLTKRLDGVAITDDELKQFHEGDKDTKSKILSKFPVSSPYFKIESTDAQEFTTLEEHLDVMYAHGKINDEQYNSLKNKKNFTSEELGLVMQPIKPVYTGHINSEGIDRRMYIKSSSFPLIPQLTKGLEIDKLRIAMERDGVPRVAFSTAVKVGNVLKPTEIYDSEGRMSDIKFDDSNTLELNRDDFGLQLEVPYDAEKKHVNTGTQERKLLFNNILGITGFKYKGETYSGSELRTKYLESWKDAYQDSYDELLQSVGGDLNNIDYKELLKIALKEAKSRGYSINDVIGIQPILDEKGEFLDFRAPLWMLPASTRVEALFVSIVENNVLKKLFNGKSFVLGTQEGFKGIKTIDTLPSQEKSGIVHTNEWTGELGSNDILVPWKFKFDIDKVTTSDGKIDASKLPSELLKLFGFRIPTQGFNSMRSLKIVGFLPKESGDLIIASRDLVVQMGSDFDVDKLYTYMYNLSVEYNKSEEDVKQYNLLKDKTLLKDADHFVEYLNISDLSDELKEKVVEVFNSIPEKDRIKLVKSTFDKLKNGFGEIKPGTEEFTALKHIKRILGNYRKEIFVEMEALQEQFKEIVSVTKLNDSENNKWKTIQNDILDMHHAVLENDSPFLQYQIHKPLDYGELDTLAANVENKRSSATKIIPSILSPDYQKSKYINARAGKIGIGSFSLDSVFASIIQGLNLTINADMIDMFKIGSTDFNHNISSIFTNGTNVKLFSVWESEQSSKSFEKWLEDINIDTLLNEGKIKISDIKLKTDVIAAYQSASVDDEKQQILAKLNIQSETFDSIRALAYIGYDEKHIQAIISQDIMFELVDKLRQKTSLVEGFSRNAHDEVLAKLIGDAAKRAGIVLEETDDAITALDAMFDDIKNYNILSIDKLYDKIGNPELNSTPESGLMDLHVLQIYRITRDLGLYIRKLQTLVNTDSAGLQQSLITTSLKEVEVSELLKRQREQRFIFNEELIIGETDEDGTLINPLTINGIAISTGLTLANDMYLRSKGKQFFPYGTSALSSIFNEIAEIIPNFSSFGLGKKTEIYNKIFNNFKSFLYSSTDSGLSSDPHTSRQLLHINNKVRPTLAQIVNGINRGFIKHNGVKIDVNTAIKSNPFIVRLETNLQNNNYSLVETNAAAAVNMDERSIHIAASYLVSNPQIIYTQGSFQYTTKDLVDDLVESAYLTGGIQEARQYLRYLPLEYVLETGGFGEYLRGLDFGFNNNNIRSRLNGLFRFTRQYMQHNPNDAYVIDIADVGFVNKVNVKEPNWDVVLSEENSNIHLVNFQSEVFPRFVSIRIPSKYVKANRKGASFVPESGFVLYEAQLDADGKTINWYKRIPTAGSNRVSEYIADSNLAKSILPGNNKGIVETKEPPIIIPPAPSVTPVDASSIVPDVEHTTTAVLNYIRENSNSVEFQEIAEEILEILNKLQLDIPLKIVNDKNLGYSGSFNSIVSGESPTYAPGSYSITMNIGSKAGATRYNFEKTFLHELLHAVSVYTIRIYENDPESLGPVLKHHYQRLDNIRNTLLEDLKAKTKDQYGNDLVTIAIKFLGELTSGQLFDTSLDGWKYHLKNKYGLNDVEISKVVDESFLRAAYQLSKLTEFVVGIKIEPDFEQYLDKIDPNLFDRIKNIIKDIINYILGETPTQHLRRVVDEIIDISADIEVASTDVEIIAGEEYQFSFNKGGRLLYVFDNVGGILIEDILVRKQLYEQYRNKKNNPSAPDRIDPSTIVETPVENPVEVIDVIQKDINQEWKLVGELKTIKLHLGGGRYLDIQAKSIVITGYEHLNLAVFADNDGYTDFGKGYKIIDIDTGVTVAYAEDAPFFTGDQIMSDLINSLKENNVDDLLKDMVKIKPDTKFNESGTVVNKAVVPEGSNPNNPIAITINGVDYLMNDDQTRAYHTISSFIKDNLDKGSNSGSKSFNDNSNKRFNNLIPNAMWDKMFGLLGKAGTGKTTIINRIIQDINANPEAFGLNWKLNVRYVGPTHTATTVLAESLGLNSEGTKDVPTFASLVAKYPDNSGNFKLLDDKKYIDQIRYNIRNPITSHEVLVFDEASMFDETFITDLKSRIELEIKNGFGSKYPIILLMGDYRQLPPILARAVPFNEGVISATVFKEKYIEMTQVMRTENRDMYNIFDSVADQIDDHRDQYNFTGKYEKFNWTKYDEVSNKSTNDILVVPERELDQIVNMYVEELLNSDDPYNMFWIHYNNSVHPNTIRIFDKIRKLYLEKLGKDYTKELVEGEYVEFGIKLPLNTKGGLYNNQVIETGTIKPNARVKILKIEETGALPLKEIFSEFSDSPFANENINVRTIIFKNRQGKIRSVVLPIDPIFSKFDYDATSKSSIFVINETTYRMSYSKSASLLSFARVINKGLNHKTDKQGNPDSILIHSYIGSSHTAQGNSIKKVIVGDFNIRLNLGDTNQIDIEKSLYTALTRVSKKLIIIKPNGIKITNNVTEFSLHKESVPGTKTVEPVVQKESIASKTLKAYINRGVTTLWIDYESKSSGRKVRKLENIELIQGLDGKFFAIQDGEKREFNMDRIHHIYDTDPQPATIPVTQEDERTKVIKAAKGPRYEQSSLEKVESGELTNIDTNDVKFTSLEVGDYLYQTGLINGVKKIILTRITNRIITPTGIILNFEKAKLENSEHDIYYKEDKALYEYHLKIWKENKGRFFADNINKAEMLYEHNVRIHGKDFVYRPKKINENTFLVVVHEPKFTNRNKITSAEKIQKWINSLSEDQLKSEWLLAEQQEREERTIRMVPREEATSHIYDLLRELPTSSYGALEKIRGWLIGNNIIDIYNNVLNEDLFDYFNNALTVYVKSMFNVRMGNLFSIEQTDIESSIVTRLVPNLEIFKIIDSIHGKRSPDIKQEVEFSPAFGTSTSSTVDYKDVKKLLNSPGLVKYETLSKHFNELWLKRQNTITQLSIDIADIETKLSKLPSNDPLRKSLQEEKSKLFEKRRDVADEANKLLNELYSMTQAVKYEEILFQGGKQSNRITAILDKPDITDEELVYVNRMIDIWRESLSTDTPGIILTQDEIESTVVQDDLLYLKRTFDNHQRNYDKIVRDRLSSFVNEQLNTVLTEEEILASVKEGTFLASWVRDISKFHPVQVQAMAKLIAKVYANSMNDAYNRNNEYNELLTKALPKLEKMGGWDVLLQKVEDSKGNLYRTGNLVFWYSQKYQDEVKSRREQTTALVDRISRNKSIPDADKKKKIHTAWKTYYNRLNKDTIHLDIRKLLYDGDFMPEIDVNGTFTKEVFTQDQIDKYHEELKNTLGESNYKRLTEYIKVKKEKFLSEFLEIKLQSGTLETISLADAKLKYFFAEDTERGVIGYTQDQYNEMKAWEYRYSPYYKAQFLADPKKTPFSFNGENIIPEDRFVLSAPRKFYPDGKLSGIYDPQMDVIESDQDIVDLYNYMFKTLAELRHYIPHYMLEGTSVNTIPFVHKQFWEALSETPVSEKLSASLRIFKEDIRGKINEEKQVESNLRINRVTFIRSNQAEINREVKLRIERIEQDRLLQGRILGRVERIHLQKDIRKQVTDELFLKNQSQDLGKIIKWYTAMVLQYQEKARYLDTLSVVEEYLKREYGEEQISYKRRVSEKLKGFSLNPFKKKTIVEPENHQLLDLIGAITETMDVFEGRGKHLKDERKWVTSTKIKESGRKKSWNPFKSDARFGILQRIGLTKKERDEYKEVLKYIEELQSLYKAGSITNDYYSTRLDNLKSLKEKFDTAGISWVAVGDKMLQYTQLLLLGWNSVSFFPNRWIGMVQNIAKASENTSFNLDAYFKAFKTVSSTQAKLQYMPAAALGIIGGIYGLSLVGAMAGWVVGNIIGKAIYKSYQKSSNNAGDKVDILRDKLDLLKTAQEELYTVTHSKNSRKKWHSDVSNPYNVINAAESLNQTEIMLSLMYSTPLVDKSGKTRTLYDAYNSDGTWNHREFDNNPDWNMDEGLRNAPKMLDLKLEMDHIITIYHGNYDPNKTIRIKRRILGRLTSQFRTWLYENMSQYTEAERKDFLSVNRSTGEDHILRRGKLGTLKTEFSSIPNMLLSAIGIKKLTQGNMSQVDFQNMSAITNMVRIYGTVQVLILVLGALSDDLDDEEKKASRFLLNMLRRLSADMDLYLLAFVDYNKIIRNSENIIPALVTVGRIWNFFNSIKKTLFGDPYTKTKELRMVKDGVKLIPYGSAAYGTAKKAEKEFK